MSDAEALLQEARKKATAKTFFGGNKLDEAADLFGRAANAFKLKKQCRAAGHLTPLVKESGDSFMEQGKTMDKLGERTESASSYLNAAKSYKKEFPKGFSYILTCRSSCSPSISSFYSHRRR
jgi:alpha-soluble NSF attachment protein